MDPGCPPVIPAEIYDEAHVVVVGNLLNLLVTLLNEFCLLLRDDDIIEVERQTSQISHTVTEVLDTVEELTGLSETYVVDHIGDDVAETLLRDFLVDIANLLGAKEDLLHLHLLQNFFQRYQKSLHSDLL